MIDKSIFNLEGKNQEQVKEAFLEFLKIDKTKPGGYSSVGSNRIICEMAKEACGVNSVLDIRIKAKANEVSKLLTTKIDEEQDYGKRHQLGSLRCHVRKYIEFLDYCEGLISKPNYEFAKDPDKPFISAEQFKKIVSLLKNKKNIILEGAPGVGKTFLARKIAYQLIGEMKDEKKWCSSTSPTVMKISCRASVLLKMEVSKGEMAFSLTSAAKLDVRPNRLSSLLSTR